MRSNSGTTTVTTKREHLKVAAYATKQTIQHNNVSKTKATNKTVTKTTTNLIRDQDFNPKTRMGIDKTTIMASNQTTREILEPEKTINTYQVVFGSYSRFQQ